jgi:hypothetical protein
MSLVSSSIRRRLASISSSAPSSESLSNRLFGADAALSPPSRATLLPPSVFAKCAASAASSSARKSRTW